MLAGAIIAGCAAKPVLLDRTAAVPPDIDLSGNWILQQAPRSLRDQSDTREQQIYIPSESSMRRLESPRKSRRSDGPSAQLFLENGSALKVTQTSHGLFISFDRSIVEEYTFGENRVVAIGPIEAQRVSGWDSRSFVVETLDDQGSVMTETWRLDDGGDVLIRDIQIVKGGQQSSFSRQRFDRTDPR